MENFFLNLNSLDELKLVLFQNFKDEKIFLSIADYKLKLEIAKNHVVEQNWQNCEKESIKAYVFDYEEKNNYEKLNNEKPIYLIFNNLNQLLNFETKRNNCFCVFNSGSLFVNFNNLKSCILNFCHKILFCLSHKLFNCLINKKLFYSSKLEVETIIRCINFFKNNTKLDLYNHFEFMLLIKKLLEIKQNLNFVFFNKIKLTTLLLSNEKIYDDQLCFLLIWLEKEFVESKNYYKFLAKSFTQRLCACQQCGVAENALNDYFNFFETTKITNLLKSNFKFIEKELNKLFFLSRMLICFNKEKTNSKIKASTLLKAINIACDSEEKNLFQFMKNLGYLDVA